MPINIVFPSTTIAAKSAIQNLEIKRNNFIKVFTDSLLNLIFLADSGVKVIDVYPFIRFVRNDAGEPQYYYLRISLINLEPLYRKVNIKYLTELGFNFKELGQFIANADGWYVRYDRGRDGNYLNIYTIDPDGYGKWRDLTPQVEAQPQAPARGFDYAANLRNQVANLGARWTEPIDPARRQQDIFYQAIDPPQPPIIEDIDRITDEYFPMNHDPLR